MNAGYAKKADSNVTTPPVLGDYIAPELKTIRLDEAFPHMRVGDVNSSTWPYLRREIRHNWYVDARNPTVGFLSRDEAAILYNSALLFEGKPCLEVGCWRGWSTAHIAAASGTLDVIDPVLKDTDFLVDVKSSLAQAGVLDCVTFYPDSSPEAVDLVASVGAKCWSLIFIDGDHEGRAPRLDAEAAVRHAAETAMVLFHDLASPYVAAGLAYMQSQGWNVMVYQTMQLMGVAWRGAVTPVEHTPDPSQNWTLPAHLSGYRVSCWSGPVKSIINHEAYEQLHASLSAVTEERDRLEVLFTGLQGKFSDLIKKISDLDAKNLELSQKLKQAELAVDEHGKLAIRLGGERDTLARLLEALQTSALVSAERLAALEGKREALQKQLASMENSLGERTREAAQAAYERDKQTRQLREAQIQLVKFSNRLAQLQEERDELARLSAEAGKEVKVSNPVPSVDLKQLFQEIWEAQTAIRERLTYFTKDLHVFWNDAYSLQVGLVLADTIAQPRVLFGLLRRLLIMGTEATRVQIEYICNVLKVPLNPGAKAQFAAWFVKRRDMFGLTRRMLLGRALEVRCLILWKLNECLRDNASPGMPQVESVQSIFAESCILVQRLEGLLNSQVESLLNSQARSLNASHQVEMAALRSQLENLKQQNGKEKMQHAHELKRLDGIEAAKVADERALLEAEIEIATLRKQLEDSQLNSEMPGFVEAVLAKSLSNHA